MPLDWVDRETLLLIDSIQYFNLNILPDVMPFHGARPTFENHEWLELPKVLQHLFIVIVGSTQDTKSSISLVSRTELYHYRGLCLRELRAEIDAPTDESESEGIVLGAILLTMLAETQLSATGSYSIHLEAARTIIDSQGGWAACFSSLPEWRCLLINYLTMDILSATTCPASLLNGVERQAQYIPILPDHEGHIVNDCCPCPQMLLEAIIHFNIFRSEFKRGLIVSAGQDDTAIFVTIIRMVRDFDPASWAEYVVPKNLPRPLTPDFEASESYTQAITGWTALATCYQSAALLHLLLSLDQTHSQNAQFLIYDAKRILSQQIRYLFQIAQTGLDAPIQAQLWKFIIWPLTISAYVKAGWDIGEQSVETEIKRLRMTSVAVGARSLHDAAELMESIVRRRAEEPDVIWHWDDGWESRCVFVI